MKRVSSRYWPDSKRLKKLATGRTDVLQISPVGRSLNERKLTPPGAQDSKKMMRVSSRCVPKQKAANKSSAVSAAVSGNRKEWVHTLTSEGHEGLNTNRVSSREYLRGYGGWQTTTHRPSAVAKAKKQKESEGPSLAILRFDWNKELIQESRTRPAITQAIVCKVLKRWHSGLVLQKRKIAAARAKS